MLKKYLLLTTILVSAVNVNALRVTFLVLEMTTNRPKCYILKMWQLEKTAKKQRVRKCRVNGGNRKALRNVNGLGSLVQAH